MAHALLWGSPFEIYFRDGVAYLLYNSYAVYTFDEQLQRWTWQSTRRVVALDVSNVADIKEIGSFNLPGNISDSRIVGTPQDIKVIDQRTFEGAQSGYAWRRSVTLTPRRMYISGITWSGSNTASSTIQGIDISNPIAGQITSRWQMDEYQGVLRVVSQPNLRRA